MTRMMTPDEMERVMRKAKLLHSGKINLPPEIVGLKKLIAEKIRNAELFTARLRVVDEGMVHEITQLRLRLDGMYAEFGTS